MRATYRFIGCALCLAGIGGAAATSLDTRDLDSSPQVMINGSSAHDDSGSSGGDATGLTRDCPPAGSDGTSTGTSGGSPDRSGGASSAPPSPHRPHLGWQSLLPGSIQ